ncbi:hypothetical protein D5R95_02630, partial [Methanosalsum natronophilum]
MTVKWKREDGEIARLVPKKGVKGIFNKQIVLSPNERAILVQNGYVQDTVNEGKISVGGLFNLGSIGKDTD